MNVTETEHRPTDLMVGQHGSVVQNRDHLSWVQRVEDHPAWHVLSHVPQTLTASVSLPRFTVHALLNMQKGLVIGSSALTTDMIPICIGAVCMAWGEFEVVEHALALRVTKLA